MPSRISKKERDRLDMVVLKIINKLGPVSSARINELVEQVTGDHADLEFLNGSMKRLLAKGWIQPKNNTSPDA